MVEIDERYRQEMSRIKKTIKSYPGYEAIAASLGRYTNQQMVAGIIGCIIPESGTNHTILNKKEYNGNGASGTSGWNCGEGLIQWTYWKNKLPLIKIYNQDKRSTQKLPEIWNDYNKGKPKKKGKILYAVQDGRHISGLTLDNQMLFLVLYYKKIIDELSKETNLAVVVAKIYQQKAGIGYCKDITDPIERAYETAKRYYPSSAGNHYLQSLKIAEEYFDHPVNPSVSPLSPTAEYVVTYPSSSTMVASNTVSTSTPMTSNVVYKLSSSNNKNDKVLVQSDKRKNEFETLRKTMVSNAEQFGKTIFMTAELYDSNILKSGQESKKERV